MAIVSLDGNTKYTTMIFKVIPEFISNDIKNNKVKDFRVVSIVGRESKQEEQKLESVNHLDEFVNFIRNNMEVTPKVIEELSYICK